MNTATIVIIIAIAIGIFWYLSKQKENFTPSFVQKHYNQYEQRMLSSRFAMIEERETKMFLTFSNGRIQLHPYNKFNANQYWLYFPDGTIMSAKDRLCLTFTGNDFPPGPEICTPSVGQKFLLQPDGRIVNLTGLPYNVVNRPDLIASQKKKCLGAQFASNDTSIRVPIVTDCDKTTSRWNIHIVPPSAFYFAQNYDYRPLAKPNTEQLPFTDGLDGFSGPSRIQYVQSVSGETDY